MSIIFSPYCSMYLGAIFLNLVAFAQLLNPIVFRPIIGSRLRLQLSDCAPLLMKSSYCHQSRVQLTVKRREHESQNRTSRRFPEATAVGSGLKCFVSKALLEWIIRLSFLIL